VPTIRTYAEQFEKEFETPNIVRLIIVGAGNRGTVYSNYALEHPQRAKVVAVADPNKFRREVLARNHNLSEEFVFESWESILDLPSKMADAVIIATPDALHAKPTIAFAQLGYHILVEKPMAVTEEDCVQMVETCKKNNVLLCVGHVMRYTPYTQKIKEIIDSGALGSIISVQHLEPVGWWHAAHSYVRGLWRREDESSFMLMTKSCHDIDWLRYVINKPVKRISSFGSRTHFKKECKPVEAGDALRCLDCKINSECPYSATTIYLDQIKSGDKSFPVGSIVLHAVPNVENVEEALRTGPYGRCVYECDNDVVDQQVVNLEYEGGITASFSMVSFTHEVCVRKTRIFGSNGELDCDGHRIYWSDFRGPGSMFPREILPPGCPPTKLSGHGGADYFLIRNFVFAVAKNDPSFILSGSNETLESHLSVFKAEQSRKLGTVVTL